MGFDNKELEAITRVMQRGQLSGYQGNWTEQFKGGIEVVNLEADWASFFNVRNAIFCNSATSGLWLACASIGLKAGDEVLVSPFTMTCSASIPLLFGAKPVFVDIESSYFCMNPDDIEHKITDKTKAIIAVSIFGQPCDFDRINAIAKKYNLVVIEDAAQSIGATYKGKYSGTLSDIGVFSLNRHKIINCGEAGVITTDNDDLAFKLKLLLNHSEAVCNDMERKGVNIPDGCVGLVGMNLRGTELSAAIAREQLKKLDGILEKYRDDAKYFPVKVRENCEHSYYRYAWIGDWKEHSCDKWELFNAKYGYIEPLHKIPLFKSLGYKQNDLPIVQEVNKTISLAWQREAY
jgi:perosamine synthetase